MDLHAHYLKNRTYRKYLPKEIEPEKLNAIMDDVVLAHCGNNRQLLRYAVVCSKEVRDQIAGQIHFAALLPREIADPKPEEEPAAYIIILEPSPSSRVNDIDLGIAAEVITDCACEEGIGSCMMLNFNKTEVGKILQLPENLEAGMVIALGYSCHESHVVPLKKGGDTAYKVNDDYNFTVPKYNAEDVTRKY